MGELPHQHEEKQAEAGEESNSLNFFRGASDSVSLERYFRSGSGARSRLLHQLKTLKVNRRMQRA